jgi:hypothetical protein
VSSGTEAERYFPLVDGNIYHYRTESFGDAPTVEEGVLMTKVHRISASHGELRTPSGNRKFELSAEGVVTWTKAGDRAFILKTPVAPGQTWLGEHGGETRVSATNVKVTVPAGTYDGCVTTLEERLGDKAVRVTTTFCPAVGVVALEASSGARVERAQLAYYGPPIDLGPEGSRRTQ